MIHRQAPELVVWRTVKLGLCKSPSDYHQTMNLAGIQISDDWGMEALDRLICSQIEVDQDIFQLSVSELGFDSDASYADICARALGLGLGLCPVEIGPALRLQYTDQPCDQDLFLHVAMQDSLPDPDHRLNFWLGNVDGVLWLDASSSDPNGLWSPFNRFVFIRPK